MSDYTHNKVPKDRKLCQIIRKTISLQKRNLGYEFEDVANELGMSKGTLENKVKPAKDSNDLTLTEFIHLLELTGDYSALEHIASHFDMALIHKNIATAKIADINLLVDKANIENSDVFRVVKKAMEDGKIKDDEREDILKEIDEAQKANAELKDLVLHIATNEDE